MVEDGDRCVAEGVLFRRGRGWGVVDDEWVESVTQADFGFSAPVRFTAADDVVAKFDRRPVGVHGTWASDHIAATRPADPANSDEDVDAGPAPSRRLKAGSLTPEAIERLVDLQMQGVITGIKDIPHRTGWRHVVFLSDLAHRTLVRRLFAPDDVTIEVSPWSREAWLGFSAAIERLSHPAGFGQGVHDGIPQHEVWLTRLTVADAAVMRAVPREMVRIERLLVKPEAYVR